MLTHTHLGISSHWISVCEVAHIGPISIVLLGITIYCHAHTHLGISNHLIPNHLIMLTHTWASQTTWSPSVRWHLWAPARCEMADLWTTRWVGSFALPWPTREFTQKAHWLDKHTSTVACVIHQNAATEMRNRGIHRLDLKVIVNDTRCFWVWSRNSQWGIKEFTMRDQGIHKVILEVVVNDTQCFWVWTISSRFRGRSQEYLINRLWNMCKEGQYWLRSCAISSIRKCPVWHLVLILHHQIATRSPSGQGFRCTKQDTVYCIVDVLLI